MATPNVVPRADQEGGLGTAAKSWGKLFIENPTAGGTAAATISNLDVDQIALDIDANNTTANIIDIRSTTLTTGKAANIDIVDSGTVTATNVLFEIDYDKSGVTGSSATRTVTGFNLEMVDAATNNASGSVIMTGQVINLSNNSNQGTITQIGMMIQAQGADAANTTGIVLLTEDGGTDLSIRSSADSGDKFTIATSAAGATTISTIDDDNHAADLTFVVDGFVKFDGAGIQSGGVEIENGSASGNAALLIDNDDVDQNALLIEAANTTNHILDIEAGALTTGDAIHVKSDALTTGAAINLDINDSLTTSSTKSLVKIDYDKSGVTASGQSSITAGLDINMTDAATNDASGVVRNFGAVITLDAASNQGDIQQTGLGVYLTDADTSNSIGIYSSVEDGGVDFKAISTADSGDYFTIAVGASGATTMTTVDDDATAAHLSLQADGHTKVMVGDGDTAKQFQVQVPGVTGPVLEVGGEDGSYSKLKMYEEGGATTNDYFQIEVNTSGTATIKTEDAAGEDGHLVIDPDGDLRVTSKGNVNLAYDITGQQSTDKVKVISQGIGHHMIVAEVDVFAASNTDNGVIKQIGTLKIPQYARITSAVVQVVELSNLGTFNMNLSIGTNSGVSAGTAPANLHELIGAGNSNTGNTDDITGSAADIQIGSGTGNLKKQFHNYRNINIFPGSTDGDGELTVDHYLYLLGTGGNGTSNATSGRVVVYVEYYGID